MSQRQSGGENSVNIQSGGYTNITIGVSATEARQIAVDVLRANLIEMQGVARQIFDERLDFFVDYFLTQIKERMKGNFEALKDPDVQYGLFVAGKEYARSGDEHIGHTLADLLIERCRAPKSSLISVVTNEAIATTGRLTRKHIATLVIHWALTRVENSEIKTVEHLGVWLQENVMPFIQDACWHVADYEYLAYTGTAGIEVTSASLSTVISRHYPGLFSQGISPGMISPSLQEHKKYFFSEHPTKDGYFHVKAIRIKEAHALAEQVGSPELGDSLENLMLQTAVSSDSIQQMLRGTNPELDKLFDLWSKTHLENLRLTSVGVAIAHAYWAHATKNNVPLAIWIPEDDVPSKEIRK